MTLFCKLINRSPIACRAHSFITSQIVENNKRMVSNLNDSNITTDPWIGDVFLTIVFSRPTHKKENVEKNKTLFSSSFLRFPLAYPDLGHPVALL